MKLDKKEKKALFLEGWCYVEDELTKQHKKDIENGEMIECYSDYIGTTYIYVDDIKESRRQKREV